MKKVMQRKIDAQRRKAEAAEKLLRERKERIAELQEEVEGLRQLIDIMGAFIGECVKNEGEIKINRHKVNLRLMNAFEVGVTEDEYILRRQNEQDN